MNEQLLVVLVTTKMRDSLIDALIACEEISGFTLDEVSGYSREHSQFDLSSQVAGYRSLYRFEVLHDTGQQDVLLERVHGACGAGHGRYWVMPLRESGAFGEIALAT